MNPFTSQITPISVAMKSKLWFSKSQYIHILFQLQVLPLLFYFNSFCPRIQLSKFWKNLQKRLPIHKMECQSMFIYNLTTFYPKVQYNPACAQHTQLRFSPQLSLSPTGTSVSGHLIVVITPKPIISIKMNILTKNATTFRVEISCPHLFCNQFSFAAWNFSKLPSLQHLSFWVAFSSVQFIPVSNLPEKGKE